MDSRPTEVPVPPPTVPAVPAPAPGVIPTWPRSVQIAVGALLVLAVLVLVGQRFLQVFTPGPADALSRRLDLNRATQTELLLLPGIGTALAERIVLQRQTWGRFTKVDDLARVPGIGPATLERIRSWVFVMEPPDPTAVVATSAIVPKPVVALDTGKMGAKPKKGANLTAPININTAGLVDLQKLPGIGPKMSQRIVDERTKKPFANIDELKRVYGIGKKTVDRLRPFVTVGEAESSTVLAGGR